MTPPPRLPPGPRLPALVQSALLFRDPVGFLEGCRRRYGPVLPGSLRRLPALRLRRRPASWRARSTPRTARSGGRARRAGTSSTPLVGEHSLLCTEGEPWLRHRKLLGPAFHRRHVEGYARGDRRDRRDEDRALAARRADRAAPADAGDHARGDPAPRLRRHRRAAAGSACASCCRSCSSARRRDPVARCRVRSGPRAPAAALRRFPNPVRTFLGRATEVDDLIYDEIAARRARARRPRRRAVDAAHGPRRGAG